MSDTVTTATTAGRRCWRCLQTFACDAADLPPGPAEWWLCEPCHQSLIGPTPAR
ncbi:MAG: hypothetical protein IPL07_04775 [Acidimicrobiaceae bacterium]|nr:hypothetical protein [Acidimicrobiaceae bacterium]